jgi:hypothetical protein
MGMRQENQTDMEHASEVHVDRNRNLSLPPGRLDDSTDMENDSTHL